LESRQILDLPGFVVWTNPLIAVVLVPVDNQQITIAQITFGEVEVPCEPILGDGSETAWGGGVCAFAQGWGSYFRCCGFAVPPVTGR